MDQEQFSELFRKSPVKRSKRRGFLRNVLIAIGNSGDESFEEHVVTMLSDDEPMVRKHAVWALYKITGLKNEDRFSEMYDSEQDEGVLEELRLVLGIL